MCATRLTEAKDKLGLSTNRFAADAGLGPSNMAKMLKGEMQITPKTLRAVANAHGVNYQWLLTGDGEMMTPKQTVTLTGQGNVNVNGSNVEQTCGGDTDEVKFLRKQLEDANTRIDKLLEIINLYTATSPQVKNRNN